MALPTLPDDKQQDKLRNTVERDYERKFNNITQNSPEYPGVQKGLRDLENFSNDASDEVDKSIAEREQEPQTPIVNNFTGKNTKVKGRGLGRKGIFGIAGGVAGVGLLGGLFFFVMTLQGNMFLENITKVASQVPGYAVERRTEYIMTRLLAIHLLRASSGTTASIYDADAKMVFCKGASVSCSLFATYGANYFDNLIDISVGERFGDNVRITLTPKGRSTLGGNARTWDMTIKRDLGDGQFLETVKTLDSNADAKDWIKKTVNNNLKTKNVVVRYLARLILMKKYGVTHWRAFEKTGNSIAETRSTMRASILKNTTGAVSKRMALYFGCLTDEATCSKLKDGLRGDAAEARRKADEAQQNLNNLDPSDPNYEAEKARNERSKAKFEKLATGITELTGDTGTLSADDINSGSTSKIIMKRVAGVAGGVGIILMLDSVFGATEAVNNGALDQIIADIRTYTYIGFAYGDETGIAPNVSKFMAGDADLGSYGELLSLFDGASASPLMQYENGLISADTVASSSYTRECSSDSGTAQTVLAQGQLVCPDRTIYTAGGVSEGIRNIPGWSALNTVAAGWNSSIGVAIDWTMNLVGDAINLIPGVTWLSERMSELTAPLIEWMMGLFFSPPEVGFETSGANNYDAFSGGIWASQNSLMEEGVSETGGALGGGGKVLTNEEVVAINTELHQEEQEEFNNQSLIARIFNPSLYGSFAQQFVARMPTSFGSLANLPATSLGYAIQGSGNAYAATSNAVNPFNIARYGYATDDPALTADPGTYTEEFCTESAAAREASYEYHPEVYEGYSTYTVSDPCALEKMVVGSMLQAEGVTDDPYSLDQLEGQSSVEVSTERPAESTDKLNGWTLNSDTDYSNVPCDSRTKDMGTAKTGSGNSTIRLCLVEDREKYPGNLATSEIERSVNSLISTQVVNMFEDAYKAGVPLGLSSAYRSDNTNEHGKGLAMDIKSAKSGFSLCYVSGGSKAVWDNCNAGVGENADEMAAFAWLQQNGAQYGFFNLAGHFGLWEPWHWSTSGG